jgi:hypothetical protein
MKKILTKIAIAAALLLPLALAMPCQAQTIPTITVGNDPAARTQLDSSSSDYGVIDATNMVSADGYLTRFHYFARNLNPFHFFLIGEDNYIKWVSEKITPAQMGLNYYTPKYNNPSPVQVLIGSGLYLGVYFISTGTLPFEGAIPYDPVPDSDPNYIDYPTIYYAFDGSVSPLSLEGQFLDISVGGDTRYRTYSFGATGVTTIPPPPTVSVTIAKYFSTGAPADANSANGASFTMNAAWSGPSAGSGTIVLGPENPIPYRATSAAMTSPASFSINEDTGPGSPVGTACSTGKSFQLVGYTIGDSLGDAVIARPILTAAPSLTGITSNKVIVVWNNICGQPDVRAGNDDAWRPLLDPYGDFTVLDTNKPVTTNGYLTQFQYYAANQSPFRFFLADPNDIVQWVSDEITPSALGANIFKPASPVPVEAWWYLGVYFVSTGTIPYAPTGSLAAYKATGSGSPLSFLGRTLQPYTSQNEPRTYSFAATGDTVVPPPDKVNVTIVKYVDGKRADAASLNGASFPMKASCSAPNSCLGSFSLGPTGVGIANAYEARASQMASGASYNVSEDTSSSSPVGTACSTGKSFQLVGYTIGDTLLAASEATPIAAASLMGITSDKFIIVWNRTCGQPDVFAGNDAAARSLLDDSGDFTVIDTNHPISANGWLTNFQYYAMNQNPFRFVLVDEWDIVQWVSDTITPPALGANTYTPKSPVPVQKGLCLGVYFVSAGTIPYAQSGSLAYYGASGSGSPLLLVGRALAYAGNESRTYSFSATGETLLPLPQRVNVTVVKYVDGKRADAASVNNASFEMDAIWSAANTKAGSGSFALGPTGVNASNSYEARTADMTTGAFFSVWEDTTGHSTVGEKCGNDRLYRLAGYTTGDTLLQAVLAASQTTKKPSLSNIIDNKYVIVWNETCPTDDDDECDDTDNGHHYGNDKGDNHKQPKDKCKKSDNGNHYGNDKRDNNKSPKDKDKDKDKKGKDGGKR